MADGDHLSRREVQVARLYAEGHSYKDIADLLCIAPATVRTHLNAIYRKLEKFGARFQLVRCVEKEPAADSGAASGPREPAPDPDATHHECADPSVATLLQELGLHQYVTAFAANAVDMAVLMTLTDSDLRELGIQPMGHRRRLVAALEQRRASTDSADESADEVPSSPMLGPLAERRHLTIAFVDLVGSTELSMRLDPEQMRDLLDGYHRVVANEVAKFDGYVAQTMGDGVLVYFGWPHAHEDDAERATWAALAVRAAIGALRREQGAPLAVRIGIASGLVVVGQDLRRDAVVFGDTPNLASRLQGLASPGQIVISPRSTKLVGSVFDLASLGFRRIKGVHQPVEVFEVRGPRAEAVRFEARIRQGLADMVGRTLELSLLEECWRRAVGGEGQVVLLTGEPGIGKSRLVRALRELRAPGAGDPGHDPVLALRCPSRPFPVRSTDHAQPHARRPSTSARPAGEASATARRCRLPLASGVPRARTSGIGHRG